MEAAEGCELVPSLDEGDCNSPHSVFVPHACEKDQDEAGWQTTPPPVYGEEGIAQMLPYVTSLPETC